MDILFTILTYGSGAWGALLIATVVWALFSNDTMSGLVPVLLGVYGGVTVAILWATYGILSIFF